jgi:hypothetical protein
VKFICGLYVETAAAAYIKAVDSMGKIKVYESRNAAAHPGTQHQIQGLGNADGVQFEGSMWSNVPEVRLLLDHGMMTTATTTLRTWRNSARTERACTAMYHRVHLEGHQVISAYPPQPAQSPPNTIRDTSSTSLCKGRSSAVRLHAALAAACASTVQQAYRGERNTNYIIAEDLRRQAGGPGKAAPSAGRRETLTPLSSQLMDKGVVYAKDLAHGVRVRNGSQSSLAHNKATLLSR